MKRLLTIFLIGFLSLTLNAQEIPGVTKYLTNGRSGLWDMITDPAYIQSLINADTTHAGFSNLGDSLMIITGGDTLYLLNYWTATAGNLENTNAGKVTIKTPFYLDTIPEALSLGKIGTWESTGQARWTTPAAIVGAGQAAQATTPAAFSDWARDTTAGHLSPAHPGDNASLSNKSDKPNFTITQTDSLLLDGSANTGTDMTFSHTWEAFKFTATGDYTVNAWGVMLKKSGTLTNKTAYVTGWIYTDSAGAPGHLVSAITESFYFGALTSSYLQFLCASSGASLTLNSNYWLVLKRSAAPAGGSVLVDTKNTGTGLYAHSANGTSWTVANNVTGNLRLYLVIYPALVVSTSAAPAIRGTSYTSYGGQFYSNLDAAVIGYGTHAQGAVGQSVYSAGIAGTSTYGDGGSFVANAGRGLVAQSTDSMAIYGESYNNEGVYAVSSSIDHYAIKGAGPYGGVHGYATAGVGVYGQSTNASAAGVYGYNSGGIGVYGQSNSNWGGWFASGTNLALYCSSPQISTGVAQFVTYPGTTDLQKTINILRSSTVAAAPGMGGSLDFSINNSSASEVVQARIGGITQSVTAGSERGALVFYTKGADGVNNRMTIDSAGYVTVKQILILEPRTKPAAGAEVDGMIYNDSGDNHLWYWNGSAGVWKQLDN